MSKVGLVLRLIAIIAFGRILETLQPWGLTMGVGIAATLAVMVGMRYSDTRRPTEPSRAARRCTAVPSWETIPLPYEHRRTLQCVEWAGHAPIDRQNDHNFGGVGPFTPGNGIIPSLPLEVTDDRRD